MPGPILNVFFLGTGGKKNDSERVIKDSSELSEGQPAADIGCNTKFSGGFGRFISAFEAVKKSAKCLEKTSR